MILWELVAARSPYDDLEIESLQQLIEEICDKKTRERIPPNCPPSVKLLIESCWQAEPNARPNFLQIIQQLDQCVLEVAISDKEARRWWLKSFSENNTVKFEVPWETLLHHLAAYLNMNPDLKIFKGLKSILVKNERELVLIEEFGNLLKWFGPVQPSNDNFLTTMQTLFTKKWFHGDISQEQAETRLAGADPGTYLIRFSSNPGSFALSKMIENHNHERVIVHIRISHQSKGKYSFVLDDKTYEFDSLLALVKSNILNLGHAAPGSKYYAQFRIKQIISGYVNTVNQ